MQWKETLFFLFLTHSVGWFISYYRLTFCAGLIDILITFRDKYSIILGVKNAKFLQ